MGDAEVCAESRARCRFLGRDRPEARVHPRERCVGARNRGAHPHVVVDRPDRDPVVVDDDLAPGSQVAAEHEGGGLGRPGNSRRELPLDALDERIPRLGGGATRLDQHVEHGVDLGARHRGHPGSSTLRVRRRNGFGVPLILGLPSRAGASGVASRSPSRPGLGAAARERERDDHVREPPLDQAAHQRTTRARLN